jgi:hypothetical protein
MADLQGEDVALVWPVVKRMLKERLLASWLTLAKHPQSRRER